MPENKVHVAVLVCTAKRPKMLAKCLVSISEQKIPDHCRLTIIVVENDGKQPTKDIVDSLEVGIFKPKGIDLIYDFEDKRGIPFARNKALEVCRKVAPDFVMMIDDDETAAPDWIVEHLQAQKEFQADIIQGHVTFDYDAELPVWFERPKFKAEHGKPLKRAATNNILMKYEYIDPEKHNLSFDNHFTQGHEDTEFFMRCRARGAKIILNQKAIVTETVPVSRLKLGRVVERMFQHSVTNTNELVYKRGWWFAFLKQITNLKHYSRFLRGLIALLFVPFVFPFSRPRGLKIIYYAVKRLSKVCGAFYGLTGRQVKYWDTVDGY